MYLFLDEHFILRKRQCFSPSTRYTTYVYNKWNIDHKHHLLSLRLKNKAGRNDSGRRIIRTRTSILKKFKLIKINYHLRYLKFGTIAAFSFIPFKNKIASLVYYNNGAASYYLTTTSHILFSIIGTHRKRFLKKFKMLVYYSILFRIKKLSFISCIEILPGIGAQYVRSPGTKARIIKFDKATHSALIQLPSKIKKIFSFYSYALTDPLLFSSHKKYENGKAGYWRTFGLKSTVRGVAMNPVDHPHGGRTKAIRYQRTPWGKTTKFK